MGREQGRRPGPRPRFVSPGSWSGSPAAGAGVKAGDRLLRIRGQAVDGLKAARPPGHGPGRRSPSSLVVRARREERDKHGRELTLTVTAGEGL